MNTNYNLKVLYKYTLVYLIIFAIGSIVIAKDRAALITGLALTILWMVTANISIRRLTAGKKAAVPALVCIVTTVFIFLSLLMGSAAQGALGGALLLTFWFGLLMGAYAYVNMLVIPPPTEEPNVVGTRVFQFFYLCFLGSALPYIRGSWDVVEQQMYKFFPI